MKLHPKIRGKTLAFFERNIAPENLFAVVLCCFPAFLFQRNTAILAAEIVLFFGLSLLRRGRAAILSPLLILCFITFFNLFVPYGKVLFHIGAFAVTDGALYQGLRRAEILVGMVFLSQFALDSSLTLPGELSKLLSEMFAAFNRITAEKIPLNLREILVALDNRLFDSYFTDISTPLNPAVGTPPQAGPKTTALGWGLLAGFPVLLYGALAVSLL
jgi:energy-coupling factor transporter transmembrane protein EcfT